MNIKTMAKGKGERAEQAREIIKENKERVCSICKKKYKGFGNNAQPVNDGRCCDNCNTTKVIPARLKKIRQ